MAQLSTGLRLRTTNDKAGSKYYAVREVEKLGGYYMSEINRVLDLDKIRGIQGFEQSAIVRHVHLDPEYDCVFGAVLDGVIYINDNYNSEKNGKKLIIVPVEK
jgi:hypothetical protein